MDDREKFLGYDKASSKDELIELTRALSEAKAPSGFEDEANDVARKFAGAYAEVKEDHVRNLYLSPKTAATQTANMMSMGAFKGMENMFGGQSMNPWMSKSEKPVFLLDAHGDEVGLMVQNITPKGTMHFLPLGGWVPANLSGSKVMVHTKFNTWIPGIVAAKPPHFMTEAERGKAPRCEDMVIDVGAVSKEDAEINFGVQIGEPVVSAVDFCYDEDRDLMLGKAFDDRIGCVAMLETMKRLQGENLPFTVKGTVSSQEEIGDRGIKVAICNVKPAIAICFEGCPADDTFTEGYAVQTAMRKGPMIRFMDKSMIANPRFMRDTIAIAEKYNIPCQTAVRSGGGNNGAVVNLAGEGIPVIVLGVPVRYIHSHYGWATYEDLMSAVDLAVAVVKEMTVEKLAGF